MAGGFWRIPGMGRGEVRGISPWWFAALGALAAIAAASLLVNILERMQEARNPFYRVVEITEETEDPAVWGKNFPLQYDGYRRTVDSMRTRFGGSEALPPNRGGMWRAPSWRRTRA